MKISDLTLESLHFDLKRYNLAIEETDTIADVIYRFIFSGRSVVSLEGSDITPDQIKEYYYSRLKNQVSKGAPIDFFLTTFSPKFKRSDISNGWINPDVSDLISLIHLQTIAKTIREIYPYSFRFIIAFKGDLYQRVGGWTSEELDNTYKILLDLNNEAEKLTGIRNSVLIKRWDDLFGENLNEFVDRWDSKSDYYYQLWNEKREPYYGQINKWKNDFSPYLEFDEEFRDAVDFFLTKEGCRIRAFNNLIFREGQALDLLQKLYPNLLIAHTRKKSKFFAIELNPHFRNRMHIKLAILEQDKKWGLKAWNEIKQNEKYMPVYFENFDYPFYFQEKKTK